MKKQCLFILFTFCLVLLSCSHNQWVSLTANGMGDFEVKNGTAEYRLDDGVITGISQSGTANSFLCTKETYADFILEFEVLADTLLNSGVQIRSNSLPDYQDGRVHGYQVEIESSDRKWAGGIYDEARRGWLYPLENNSKGQEAFNRGEWNHYRIEAIGNEINSWVNGIQCARLVDGLTREGFIGFQVHSISDPSLAGKTIKWRNIRICTTSLDKYATPIDPAVQLINTTEN